MCMYAMPAATAVALQACRVIPWRTCTSRTSPSTSFAPRGWSIAYSEDNLIFANDRTKWACEPTASYLRSLAGDEGSIGRGAQNYLLSIGVSQEDIDCFRTLMLTQ